MVNASTAPLPLANGWYSTTWSQPWSFITLPYLVSSLLAYTLLCGVLRYRRMHKIENEYYFGNNKASGYKTGGTPRPLSQMTDQQAHGILTFIADYEFPALYEKGLQLALFRTYGIPSISKLLVATTQLSANRTVGKRYADTTAIIGEIYASPPDSERGIDAYARLNYLHGHYIRQGKIKNDDMLYTLALFMNHPVEWIARFEWRQLTDVEKCAIALIHLRMGRGMDIDLSVLPSEKSGWRDGLHFYEELDQWAKEYERKCMVPDKKNWETAAKTLDFLLSSMPQFLHGFVRTLACAAMDERLRTAIMFDDPGFVMPMFFEGFMMTRKYALRYLSLPRFIRLRFIVDKVSPEGRRYFNKYDTLPYYIEPTLWNRFGPSTWSRRLMGLPLPGDQGMFPEGYLMKELGPKMFLGKGAEEAEETRHRLRGEKSGGCPFGIIS